ncbi:MAG: biotin--[acetyl-CoA-carboxylase] ligase, partial [Sphingomonadaceae bacterium]
ILARAGELPDGTWVRAERQTAGRGRQGRGWTTLPGNLAASGLVKLRPGDGPAEQIGFAAGVALHETLLPAAGAESLLLKWPNDLLLGQGKLAGILLERQGDAIVVGVGANLASAPEVPGRKTAALPPPPPAPDAVLAMLASRLAHWLDAWRTAGFEAVRAQWCRRAHPPGTLLHVAGPPAVSGRFRDLGPDGALQLDTPGGPMTIRAGDVLLAEPEGVS